MKRDQALKILIISLFVMAGITHETMGQFRIGVKPAVNSPRIFASTNEILSGIRLSQDIKISYAGGLVLQYIHDPHKGFQTEVNYSQKGWSQLVDTLGNTFSTTLNYVEVPLMAHAYLGKNKVRYFLNAGPYVGYLLSYEEERTTTIPEEDIAFQYVPARDNKWELGLKTGAGINVATGIGVFQLEGNLTLGLTSIIYKYAREVPNTVQHQVGSISLSYMIGFGENPNSETGK